MVEYTGSKGEKRTAYSLTRDAFTLVAMGFTGARAIQWKIKYIEAFNLMEKELTKRQPKALPAFSDEEKALLQQVDGPTKRAIIKEYAKLAATLPEFEAAAVRLCILTTPPPPPEPPLVPVFWEVFGQLEEKGHRVNYSITPRQIAFNLPQVIKLAEQEELCVLDRNELRRQLPYGREPKFVRSNHTVHNSASGKPVKCWIFQKGGDI